MYYFLIKENRITGIGQCPCESEGCVCVEVTQEQYELAKEKGNNYFLYEEGQIVFNPDYEEEEEAKEIARLDALTLTPADVERALYKAKGMDFEDLIQMIEETSSGIDMKALKIEFKASMFYRGAKFGNSKLFDVIGGMLGYSADDMDYLFENKELP